MAATKFAIAFLSGVTRLEVDIVTGTVHQLIIAPEKHLEKRILIFTGHSGTGSRFCCEVCTTDPLRLR